MKRIFLIFALCCIAGVATAADTTCLRNNTKIFTIHKSVNPISASVDSVEDMTWHANFDYDLMVAGDVSVRSLRGRATCNEVATKTDESAVTTGAANVYLRPSAADVGLRCWCALDGPVTSWWVYLREFDSEANCATGCAAACANAMRDNTDNFRTNGLYLAIW